MIDGQWGTNNDILKQQAVSFYAAIFGWCDTTLLVGSFARWRPMMSLDDHAVLLRPFEMEEIKVALFTMKGLKAPRLDGIQPFFFQRA